MLTNIPPQAWVAEVVPTNARADRINETALDRHLACCVASVNENSEVAVVATDSSVTFEVVRVGRSLSQARGWPHPGCHEA